MLRHELEIGVSDPVSWSALNAQLRKLGCSQSKSQVICKDREDLVEAHGKGSSRLLQGPGHVAELRLGLQLEHGVIVEIQKALAAIMLVFC